MFRLLIAGGVLFMLYRWVSQINTSQATVGITLLAVAFLITFVGLNRT